MRQRTGSAADVRCSSLMSSSYSRKVSSPASKPSRKLLPMMRREPSASAVTRQCEPKLAGVPAGLPSVPPRLLRPSVRSALSSSQGRSLCAAAAAAEWSLYA